MKNSHLFLCSFLFSLGMWGQEIPLDSLEPEQLEEVILISRQKHLHEKQTKPLTTLEGYLEASGKVDMLKRGAYAWEPILNSMTSERTVITIDGMRIFPACTDKMDPVTSYVEISNLSEASISSGQQGSEHGATIGGSIDLKRARPGFVDSGWQASLNSGFETNNSQKILGGAVSYADSSFYVDTNLMYRNADDYFAGGNQKIAFSKYTKFNASVTAGIALDEKRALEASVIYDKANDVGYPALPMDVSLAEAFIASLKYVEKNLSESLDNWESKIYYNSITHIMDDSQRPDVQIHMDMPGWSDTYGLYSKLKGKRRNHHFSLGLNSFLNRSLAEMTMYPANPEEKPMFMLTWPDVLTWYTGVNMEDHIELDAHSSIKLSTGLGSHWNKIRSNEGLQSLRIFYLEMEASRSLWLGSIAGNYLLHHGRMQYNFGLGYGHRAPSVSEAYGFYLFNSFDAYDYIGNPDLDAEKSAEINASVTLKDKSLELTLGSSFFHIMDYIIGKPSGYSPMTLGAHGVKLYHALDYARIWNTDLHLEVRLSEHVNLHGQLVYSYGADDRGENLPLISPLSYKSSLDVRAGLFSSSLEFYGNATQTRFSPEYGEDRTPAFAVVNITGNYRFRFGGSRLSATIGVENILDNFYSTYADWNNIPRMGRNGFVSLEFRY